MPQGENQESLLEPVRLRKQGTGKIREVIGDHIGGMVPYFFIAFCFMGVVYPAIHLGAGEKERGTLETLLLAPIPRHQVVLGKFLAVFCGGIIAVLLNLASLGTWLAIKAGELRGIIGTLIGSIELLDLVLLALMLIPVAAMFAALLLSVSIFARKLCGGLYADFAVWYRANHSSRACHVARRGAELGFGRGCRSLTFHWQ